MAHTKLLILGAGFSAPIGIPTMTGCLPALRSVRFGGHQWEFGSGSKDERVVAAEVLADWVCSDLDVEAYGEHLVKNALDQAGYTRLTKFSTVLIRGFELSMQQLGANRIRELWAGVYLPFAEAIGAHGSIVVVTFNYDILLDQALLQQGYCPQYELGGDVREVNAASQKGGQPVRVLRPNGSMNWFVCDQPVEACQIVTVKWQRDGCETEKYPGNWGTGPERHQSHLPNPDREAILRFLIVPPGMKIRPKRAQLKNVHECVRQAIMDANETYILGWSAPSTDKDWATTMFGHYTNGAKIVIVNRAPREELEPRYGLVLPAGVHVDWYTDAEGHVERWKTSDWSARLFG